MTNFTPLLLALGLGQDAEPPRLLIDPLLVAEVVEVYRHIASDDNPVWPGWNAADTPILLYLPDVQDVLVNHPSPPAGFVPVESDLLPEGWTMHLRDGETHYSYDGQNTSTSIGGVQTLVVADSISNMRPQILQVMNRDLPSHEKAAELTVDLLSTDPYTQLGFVVHEAFHVHQNRAAANQGGNDLALLRYPYLSAENNAGFALEGMALARALLAEDVEDSYLAALEWLAVRKDRRRQLTAEDIAYEDGTEFNEGLAKYTEWRLSTVLEGTRPGEAMGFTRGFRGYQDLTFWRERLLERMQATMSGEFVVNDDPYGPGQVRFRLYDSGMAIGALLDLLEAGDWRERMFMAGETLTGIAEEVLFPAEEDLAEALERARSATDYAALLEVKRKLETDGQQAALDAAAEILAGEALFTIDYSALDQAAVGWGFSPFGIVRVDDRRTIFKITPVTARIGSSASLKQSVVSPALHDPDLETIQFQLTEPVDAEALAQLVPEVDAVIENIDVQLPGATVQASRGRFRMDANGLVLEVLPD